MKSFAPSSHSFFFFITLEYVGAGKCIIDGGCCCCGPCAGA